MKRQRLVWAATFVLNAVATFICYAPLNSALKVIWKPDFSNYHEQLRLAIVAARAFIISSSGDKGSYCPRSEIFHNWKCSLAKHSAGRIGALAKWITKKDHWKCFDNVPIVRRQFRTKFRVGSPLCQCKIHIHPQSTDKNHKITPKKQCKNAQYGDWGENQRQEH